MELRAALSARLTHHCGKLRQFSVGRMRAFIATLNTDKSDFYHVDGRGPPPGLIPDGASRNNRLMTKGAIQVTQYRIRQLGKHQLAEFWLFVIQNFFLTHAKMPNHKVACRCLHHGQRHLDAQIR